MDALYLDFVNSEFRDFRGRWVRDELQQPGWLEALLLKWDVQVDTPLDATTQIALVALRTLLARAITSLVEGEISEQEQAEFNAILLKVPLSRRLQKDAQTYTLEMVPLEKNWDWVQAEIVASFVHTLTSHDARRLKICANPNCRWVFYDESKSRTKLYCTSNLCANLMKIRRFRTQHANPS